MSKMTKKNKIIAGYGGGLAAVGAVGAVGLFFIFSSGQSPDWDCVRNHPKAAVPEQEVQIAIAQECGVWLDPVPAKYVRVVEIADQLDFDRSTALAWGAFKTAGVNAHYSKHWEVFLSPKDAQKYRTYLTEIKNVNKKNR